MIARTLVDTVPKQLPIVLPCLRYGLSPAVPGGLPRTCWGYPWQLRPEFVVSSSLEMRRNPCQETLSQPLLPHVVLDVASHGRSEKVPHALPFEVSEGMVEEVPIPRYGATGNDVEPRQDTEVGGIVTASSSLVEAGVAEDATSYTSKLKQKLFSASRSQARFAERLRAKHYRQLTLRAWATVAADARQKVKFSCELQSRSRERGAQLAALRLRAEKHMESLHQQARMQRRAHRMQRAQLLKKLSFRSWVVALRLAAIDTRRHGLRSALSASALGKSAKTSNTRVSKCSCPEAKTWGCSCNRVYPKGTMLAHRHFVQTAALTPPRLDAKDADVGLAIKAIELGQVKSRCSVPPPPGLEHMLGDMKSS